MKKGIKIVLILSLLVFTLSSCLKKQNNEVNDKGEKKYNRVVILDPAVIEMFYLLEAEDKIVGIANMERSKIWPEEKVKTLESVGTFSKPSLEKIISLKPDLVITSFHTTEELNNGLKSNGIETKQYRANSIESIFKNYEEVAKIVEKENIAKKHIEEKNKKINEIKEILKEEKKGLFILSANPLMAFGNNTLPNDILKLLNIKNIATSLEGASPVVTPEYIIKENPEIILTLLKNPDEIEKANPNLKDVDAIKNKKVIVLDSSQVLRGSPKTIDHIIDVYEKIKK